MEYRQLGRTGIRVSPLCLGMMVFNRSNLDTGVATVNAAFDAGINFIDTANVYSRGESEEVTGAAVGSHRDDFVVATKVFGNMTDTGTNDHGSSRRHVIMQCEASLRRLKTDWIDLYQLHRPDASTPIEETLMAMDDLVRSGKVRYVGFSTFPAWQTMEALAIADRRNLSSAPVSEQPPYSLLDRRVEREVVPLCLKYGIGIIPWSPLHGGLLTGKYNDSTAGEGRLGATYAGKDPASDPGLAAAGKLKGVAEGAGQTLTQMALSWLMQRPGVTAPIIGPRNLEQLEQNLAALDAPISADMQAEIDAIVTPGEAVVPL